MLQLCSHLYFTGFVYPVVTHWAWSDNGWLLKANSDVAYLDFAGSGVVHMVGGMLALTGAICVGPRIGRFDKSNDQSIRGHTVPVSDRICLIIPFSVLFRKTIAINLN